ncbi:MAG TPA: hypothetical protein VK611_17350 [Acidimicrobiales bacterium]|nr:hypothetical protein [Acidimicrobiales bacterium]
MATTDSGIAVPAGPRLAPRSRRARPLRPLATASYQPMEPPEPESVARPRVLLTYAVPMVVVGVLALRWHDLPPLLLDGVRAELWSTWSHQLSGGGSSSYPMTRAVEAGAVWLGLSPALLTAAVAVYAAVAVTSLARAFVRPPAASFAGVFAVVNPYVLATLPDPRPLVAVATAGALATMVWARRTTPLAVVLVLLPVSWLATEPLLLVALAVWTLGWAAGVAVADGRRELGQLVRLGVWAVPLGLLSQLWWLVPLATTWGTLREGIAVRPSGLFTSTAVAVVVPLVVLGAAELLDRRLPRPGRHRRRRWRALPAGALTVAIALGVLALPLPLWTGDVASGSTDADRWTPVAAAVDGSAVAGKALVLPVASPADGLPARVRRPVLQRATDSSFRLPDALDDRLRAVDRLLTRGDAAAVGPALDQLGVSHLVIRRDAPGRVVATAARLRGWRPLAQSDVADVFERVRPAPLVDVLPADADGVPPRLAWARHDAAHYEVDVRASGGGPFVLTLADTFGAGWQVSGLPPTWSARHGVVDGYANGWRIEGEGTATLHLRHRPTQLAQIAALVSVAALAAAVLLALRNWAQNGRDPAPGGTGSRGCGDAHLT